MERAFGLDIPQSLEEVCDRKRMALLIYDMQVGIMSQLPKERGEKITANIVKVLQAARQAGVRVFFFRHISLPLEVAGVFQLRMAMAWQRSEAALTQMIINILCHRPRPGTPPTFTVEQAVQIIAIACENPQES